MIELEFDPPIAIQGNGSSIWGKSKGEFLVTKAELDEELESLELFGKKTEWTQYTDKAIAKNVNKSIKPLLEAKINKKIKIICWSEQGMQPDGGWNFDCIFSK